MNINNPKVIVGFSGNPEIIVRYDDTTPAQKVLANEISLTLSGGAVTVAYAIKQLSNLLLPIKLLIATAQQKNWRDELLINLLNNSNLADFELIPIREIGRTGIACQLIPSVGQSVKVIGDKGEIVYNSTSGIDPLKLIEEIVTQHPHTFRVVTGVRPDEGRLIQALFNGCIAGRIFNPRAEFGALPQKLEMLIKVTDMLICNDFEFSQFLGKNSTQLTSSDFLVLWKSNKIPIMVVTRNSSGAVLIYHGEVVEIPSYKAGKYFSEIGAGDWWLAAFLSYLLNHDCYDLHMLDKEMAIEASKYATIVAGIKVIHSQGTLDGPTMAELQNHIT